MARERIPSYMFNPFRAWLMDRGFPALEVHLHTYVDDPVYQRYLSSVPTDPGFKPSTAIPVERQAGTPSWISPVRMPTISDMWGQKVAPQTPVTSPITPTDTPITAEEEVQQLIDEYLGKGGVDFDTFEEAYDSLPNENWEVITNEFGRFAIGRKQRASPYEQWLMQQRQDPYLYKPPQTSTYDPYLSGFPSNLEEGVSSISDVPLDSYGRPLMFNERTGEWYSPYGGPPKDYIDPYQQQMLAFQQQQLAQVQAQAQMQAAEQERQHIAQLSAQPRSWLEYASYTGEQPVTQPWMMPLMPQQYQSLGVGEPIPGWTKESATEMPALTRPSAQYQARMGPTGLEQYLGYKQARTSAPAEETLSRLWSTAPPAGRNRQLSWMR